MSTPGAVIALACWAATGVFVVRGVYRSVREDARMRELRRIAAAAHRPDEARAFTADDLADREFDQAVSSYCDWVNGLPVREPDRRLAL